jgi:hypothetical protein
MVVHNNLLGDAKLMGINYVDEDVVVDGDLVSARTGGEHVAFAQRIIALIHCNEFSARLTKELISLKKESNALNQIL